MKINILSDYIKFKKIFGINGAMTAALTQAKELSKDAEIKINSNEKCDIINSHGCMPYTYYKMLKAKKQGTPIIISAHQTHYDTENTVFASKLIMPLVKWFLKKYYELGNILIAPVENSKKIIKKELCPETRIEIIRNGIDTSRFKKDSKKRINFRKEKKLGNKFTIISVGMPVKRKGFHTFFNIAKKIPECNFLWVGKIAFPLIQKKPKTKLKNLIMPGYVDDLSAAYSSADVFFFPSLYEGQGIVILEAASTGLPIIVRDIPTYDGWLINNKNCLKSKNEEEFIKKIKYLKENPKERIRLSKESLKLAKENDIKIMTKKMLRLFKEIKSHEL